MLEKNLITRTPGPTINGRSTGETTRVRSERGHLKPSAIILENTRTTAEPLPENSAAVSYST
jgi:hypothetical protein